MQPTNCNPTVTDQLRIDGVDQHGRPKVERKHVFSDHSSTVAHSIRMPSELAAFVTDSAVAVAYLPSDIQAWIKSESEGVL